MARAFSAALFHDGGLARRLSGAVWRALFLTSSPVGLRPVRPRASREPAPLRRSLLRLFRFVCAIAPMRVVDPRAAPGRAEAHLAGSSRARRGARERRARRP